MKNQITSRDYELISAYLDNQLGSQERTRLEARMKANPELRNELYEISKTRLLVRSLPKLRAPRNYYINAKVSTIPTRIRPTLRLAPSFGIISAVASILLVLVIFGDKFLTTTTQVALAPAPVLPSESINVQQEVQRSVSETSSPTVVPPMVMMGAQVAASPNPPTSTLKMGQEQIGTPTTIYLYAYPPTSTPEKILGILNDQSASATNSCEESNGAGEYPPPSYVYNCSTPTGAISESLQSLQLNSTVTPSTTPSITPIPTSTPLPSVIPTEAPPLIINIAPTTEAGVPSGMTTTGPVTDTANPTPTGSGLTKEPGSVPNTAFIQYIVLAAEISLATIAIITGIIAIILRIRAGR